MGTQPSRAGSDGGRDTQPGEEGVMGAAENGLWWSCPWCRAEALPPGALSLVLCSARNAVRLQE